MSEKYQVKANIHQKGDFRLIYSPCVYLLSRYNEGNQPIWTLSVRDSF